MKASNISRIHLRTSQMCQTDFENKWPSWFRRIQSELYIYIPIYPSLGEPLPLGSLGKQIEIKQAEIGSITDLVRSYYHDSASNFTAALFSMVLDMFVF